MSQDRTASKLDLAGLPEKPAFFTVLEAVYAARYSGKLTIHFLHGKPYVVEAPPIPAQQIRLSVL